MDKLEGDKTILGYNKPITQNKYTYKRELCPAKCRLVRKFIVRI